VGFVVDKVPLGQCFLRTFMCASVSYLFLQCSIFCEQFTEVPLVYHPQCQRAQFHAELRNKNRKESVIN
jgi:hypothetical protein